MGFFLIFSYPQFLSTPSVGRATAIQGAFGTIAEISIHALRGEGDLAFARGRFAMRISIHALRGEGDTAVVVGAQVCFNISIHALRGEGDVQLFEIGLEIVVFLSTPSVGRATFFTDKFLNARRISIHALRGEGDYNWYLAA